MNLYEAFLSFFLLHEILQRLDVGEDARPIVSPSNLQQFSAEQFFFHIDQVFQLKLNGVVLKKQGFVIFKGSQSTTRLEITYRDKPTK